jgi:hypothetical protein
MILLLVCLVKAWVNRLLAPRNWWEPFADLHPVDLIMGWVGES